MKLQNGLRIQNNMDTEKTITEIAKEICDKFNIKYEYGAGPCTLNGKPISDEILNKLFTQNEAE